MLFFFGEVGKVFGGLCRGGRSLGEGLGGGRSLHGSQVDSCDRKAAFGHGSEPIVRPLEMNQPSKCLYGAKGCSYLVLTHHEDGPRKSEHVK